MTGYAAHSDAPTVGILLCIKAPKDQAVRYALASTAAPVAVAGYTYDTLTPEEQASLPDATTLAAAIAAPVHEDD